MGFFSGLLKGALGLLGGTKGILGGIDSALSAKETREIEEMKVKGQLENTREQGKEQRKTSLYETQLAGAVDEYGRARKRGAFKNFGYTAANDPYAQAQMRGYQQVWKPEDTQLNLPQPDVQNLAAPAPRR